MAGIPPLPEEINLSRANVGAQSEPSNGAVCGE
jgi:hypothetical protein